jgi:16S rRNA (cytosine967-C5)-methyltransferase
VPVDRLPGFADGAVSVQDAAAQRAAGLLVGAGLAPGARVLDACAAPGGKTAHLLELADLDVLALASDPKRLARVDDALARLHLKARTQAGDARCPDDWWDGRPFDAILLDAPCSASGIVRRHPDIRWLRRAEDIAALGRIQSELLDALWPVLKPGGWLLYATCSVFRTEGERQIDAFLQRRGTSVAHLDGRSPGHLLPLPDNGSTGAISPGSGADVDSHGVADGFYYALLRKEPAAGGN